MTTASAIRLPAAYPPPGHRRPARLNPATWPAIWSRPRAAATQIIPFGTA